MQGGIRRDVECIADGSAQADAGELVRIDSTNEVDRMRYRCPNNHTRWTPTNSHVYCHSCADLADAGEGPEYYEIRDAKTDRTIPWSRVVLE